MSREFRREVRYTVIKHSKLTANQVKHLEEFLFGEGIPTIEAVVIEPDWPEFGPAWAAIEKRMKRTRRGKKPCAIQVWHQDSPGIKVWVVRGWWGRLLRNKYFAGAGEKTYPSNPDL